MARYSWTPNRALKATNLRFKKIDLLLQEIAALWGDEDEYIVRQAEELRRIVDLERIEVIVGVQAAADEREQQRQRDAFA